ncbi:hypothetical protein ABK046_45945, partial [Streptomyces caeruleatus]
FRSLNFVVMPSPAFVDPVTGKSREYDMEAIEAFELQEEDHWLFLRLIVECENNKQPVVFFTKEAQMPFLHHHEVKMAGVPLSIMSGRQRIPI